MNKELQRIKELTKIREKRERLNSINKPQKRKIEIIEYDDGTYSMIGFAWDLPLLEDEVVDAFETWFNKELEQEVDINKLIK